ncbi:hypothetical protein [Oceaniglobus roseus]|uniref:hypothetical protein n=1 Tax=Oceaniglobus roseus TaxID=1737570 RepID=UPI000C7F0E54|nr:hypothetical protein [Kandeliimicrobium roseum]
MEGAAFYLPGVGFGLGLWAGLRWPLRAAVLLGALAVTAFLALWVISGMVADDALLADNGFVMRWVVAPGLLAFLAGEAVGVGLARIGGGGME